ncbi:hypothetical protein DRL66_07980 [Salmonella enterica subsp. enterica serovar Muenchen]|nr:hypothetical protein [Salmonella enterica subsp. enterica serovar Muenchen]
MLMTTLNTATDAFCWLCLLESELLSIWAFHNAGLYTPYDEADEDAEPGQVREGLTDRLTGLPAFYPTP